ncbi:class A beta-lactamase [Amantichitinum ursilacus]|uniref:Beta-lactamase n=1 Tax=Amantichitinum ursilacus TaxID=857265 RepID=A0A0N1JTG1_9NEIS|nr:class A beta-lactamase [Amantichitinum ursilacus]KPC54479.1 Beta-lactamase [Amantichitinum ursilacus]
MNRSHEKPSAPGLSATRRNLLKIAALTPLAFALPGRAWAAAASAATSASPDLAAAMAALEHASDIRIGVSAFDTGNGKRFDWRADERFAFCSTFKFMLAAAVLNERKRQPRVLQERLLYTHKQLPAHSPITEKHVADGMIVSDLCKAAIEYSDNGAANALLRYLGGPAKVTAFARKTGNASFRLDRMEPELNTSIPGDVRDTVTPADMARSLQTLVLGEALPEHERGLLSEWLKGNTTGDKRIRAGVPAGWMVGDKTGTGAYGSTNDIAVLWPGNGAAPICMAIYVGSKHKDADPPETVLAEATRIALKALAG